MLSLCLKFTLLIFSFGYVFAFYDNYNFKDFPQEELRPLTAAYGLALENYVAQNWTEAIANLESSLRLFRLFTDTVRYCSLRCNRSSTDVDEPSVALNKDLNVYWRLITKASCQRKCRERFPVLRLPPPGNSILEDFNKRTPYKYLHFAHSMVSDLQSAIPCAFTYLQKNPEDQELQNLMDEYKIQYNLTGFLEDYEERPYESHFLRGVKLVTSEDFDGSTDQLEEALKLYLHEFELCQYDCEGVSHLPQHQDLYATITDVYVEILKCELKCEDKLKPSVGGFFVEKFLSTIYHYLQYAYYKSNNGRNAVQCAHSYFLFEPEDQVMRQNLVYYEAYSEQWGLQPEDFTPRQEALRHYNQTVAQKHILTFAEKYMKMDDEDFFGAEEAAALADKSPDVEFEGMGDYEESFLAKWTQPKDKGDTGESNL
ncbi:endoplasmic reticulum protein SC65-like [Eucyclogobius newberryi]|uniref:endoplasmic reticulum protein SC65-like n=1 Tax=Eucyclogobius newberryi TaxID=166745 RepID=UPI003B5CD559